MSPEVAHCSQSQCGGMSAAGESRLCIVIATCAGGSAHRRARAEIDALQRQALALDAEPSADVPPWVLLGVRIAASKRSRAA
jgi:hypothetical protein